MYNALLYKEGIFNLSSVAYEIISFFFFSVVMTGGFLQIESVAIVLTSR